MEPNRRPPKSLHCLAKEMLVSMALEATQRSQSNTGLAWLGWPFTCMESKAYRRHALRHLQLFLASNAPNHFNELALDMYKKEPGCIEAILHPLLRTLEVNSKSLPLVLDYAYNLTKIKTLYLFFDINRHISLIPKFHSFVGSLKQLTHLKLSNCCTDSLLGVLGANCPQLQVLDAEEDAEMTITDQGLAFLANCSKLNSLLLNDAGDEYDYEDRYFGITGKGLANLLISLDRLSLLVCEPYLLREAVRFVQLVNVGGKEYNLRYLHAKYPDRDFLDSVRRLCPRVRELVVEDPVEGGGGFVGAAAEEISRMAHLESLLLDGWTWHFRDEEFFKPCFGRLVRLTLKNPKLIVVDWGFVLKLGEWCQNLKALSVTLYKPDVLTKVHGTGGKTFFPQLSSLSLDGDVSLYLIESLLSSLGPQLHSLAIYIHDLVGSDGHYPNGQFDHVMLKLARARNLSGLVQLRCFQWRVSLETMLFVVDQCPGLRHVWGLDLLMLCPASIAAIVAHIRKNNRHIELHDYVMAPGGGGAGAGPSGAGAVGGIPFLSERSKHRVEASSEHLSEEDRLDHLLKEGTLDDLLKEVSLL